MKWLSRPKFIYVSPWLLAAATGLLVLIVVTFAVSNIQREKRLMINAMLQKAATLHRVIRSGARASYISDLRRGIWKPDPWQVHVQRIIDHLSDDPDLSFITVVDDRGMAFAHSRQAMCGKQLDLQLPADLPNKGRKRPFIYRVVQEKELGRFFEVIRSFTPFQPMLPRIPLSLQELHRQFSMPFGFGRFPAGSKGYYIIVALDMKGYDHALGRLRFQVVMLSLTMLLVGVGGWLSLSAVQGYRVSRKALHEIKAFTGLLVSKLPVGIIATDIRGHITTWNRAVEQLMGIEAPRAIGKKPEEILPRKLADFFSVSGAHSESYVEQAGQEVRLIVHEEEVVLNCHHLVISDRSEKAEGEVLLISNLTALKNLEKEMRETERLAAVGRMAAGVAHEVRNPLSSVKGLALLLQGKFPQKSNEHETATLLIQEVERMNRTISELLSFARPAPLDLADIDVGELLKRQVRLLAADAASDGIMFTLDLADDLRSIAGDQDRLNQVFINILLNAMQAMTDGGELIVSAHNNTGNKTVVITVADAGPGMEKETLNQVFFPYFTTKKSGTGIGLAISQKVIADHGGTIQVQSVPGRGTVVTIELPVKAAGAQ
ncbi:MAG TPA: PAS domain S-box protein [Desulfobulbaceae bacterium]|nr:PAS domain S-box protein [Desulfobulbaceae bacterium]